ncbi:MAG: hypothetical protein WAL91_03310 [Propionicimonas sp.]
MTDRDRERLHEELDRLRVADQSRPAEARSVIDRWLHRPAHAQVR